MNFFSTYAAERKADKECHEALETMQELLTPGDMILTNFSHYSWTMMDYYMPGYECVAVSSADTRPYTIDYPLDTAQKYWAVWKSPMKDEDLVWLKDNGYDYKDVILDGTLGDTVNSFYLYELIPIQ